MTVVVFQPYCHPYVGMVNPLLQPCGRTSRKRCSAARCTQSAFVGCRWLHMIKRSKERLWNLMYDGCITIEWESTPQKTFGFLLASPRFSQITVGDFISLSTTYQLIGFEASCICYIVILCKGCITRKADITLWGEGSGVHWAPRFHSNSILCTVDYPCGAWLWLRVYLVWTNYHINI